MPHRHPRPGRTGRHRKPAAPARRRRLTAACTGAVAAGALVVGGALATGTFGDDHAGPRPPGAAGSSVAAGAFLGSGSDGVRRIAELRKWLGGADLRVGHTYLPGDTWERIESDPYFLRPWAQWRRADPDRLFVLNVPMQARNEAGLPDHEVRELLAQGARGRFDHHFRTLAGHLVSAGVPDTVIVLGWEMNGTTYTHRCAPDPRAWKTYWRRIVAAMRSVDGQRFRFDFAPSRGKDAIGWTECYPGDDVVDIIGMDSYDQPPGETFDDQVNQPYGLRHQVDFAAARGKPISYPEWGLFRRGDNAEYMRRMLDWIDERKPLYHTISDYCPHGVWRCEENPESSAVFRARMKSGVRPPERNRPGFCVDLGDWLGGWFGDRRLCVTLSWTRRS
ncbi:glycoside hydrolase family 26 protein [Streptomyces sp. CNQ085]|uniref:glycoside hydrolase family 26 protein n=1 Tax=Streptomyces sp. CNQ085 TaxID=2886944 RepID=UPI001F510E8E|nr:glycosyl hydrolase [Streptomyces sp. CNQ085]MCI0386096.1 glycosyl hydrolase family 26 [Streptomyces sp. CNQ085]